MNEVTRRGGDNGDLRVAIFTRLMSSVAGSPVRTSATPARALGSPGSAPVYGAKSPVWLAKFDPATSSWKTCQHCLVEGLATFSETWPRSGMTRNGTAYQLPTLVPLTAGTESGLLPTPTGSEGAPESSHARTWSSTYASLHNYAMGKGKQNPRWPTPTSRDWKDGSAQACANVPENGLLGRVIHNRLTKDGLWTTPCADDTGARKVGYAQGGMPLSAQAGGSLNPTWVEWLQGFPLGWTIVEGE